MLTYFFWDIENVSIHNLEKIMKQVRSSIDDKILYVVYSKIKEKRKEILLENGWQLVPAPEISRNAADNIIKKMIDRILNDDKTALPAKIVLVTEDKGFSVISKRIIARGIKLEVICGTKDPQWIKDLMVY